MRMTHGQGRSHNGNQVMGDHKQSHMPVIIKQDTLPGLIESHLNDLSGRGSYGLPSPAGEAEHDNDLSGRDGHA